MGLPRDYAGLIRILRGKSVILDRDLARLYGVEAGALNRAVKRNRERFPEDFMFKVTPDEPKILRCQIGTSSWGGQRWASYAFTEQGVAMLSSVLRSPRAIAVNIAIMRAFVRLRQAIEANAEVGRRLSDIEKTLCEHGVELGGEHAQLIQRGLDAIARLMQEPEEPRKRIGFEGA
ncbi:MAG: ORF6N domain-containing protein [Elusimicrobia bacterium]|nr:ORF6N domain-containing protein [Elusimicrobiota bacterium]